MSRVQSIRKKWNSIDVKSITALDISFLIREAEKSEHQQQEIEQLKGLISDIQHNNDELGINMLEEYENVKRYKKAMYEAIEEILKAEFCNAVDILEKSLKGEE